MGVQKHKRRDGEDNMLFTVNKLKAYKRLMVVRCTVPRAKQRFEISVYFFESI